MHKIFKNGKIVIISIVLTCWFAISRGFASTPPPVGALSLTVITQTLFVTPIAEFLKMPPLQLYWLFLR